jgi:hypothetical protein
LTNYEVSNESIRSFERQGYLKAVESDPTSTVCECRNEQQKKFSQNFDNVFVHWLSLLMLILKESLEMIVKLASKKYIFLFNDILMITDAENKEKQGNFSLFRLRY